LKYDNGWSLSESGPFAGSINISLPSRTNYQFSGYYTARTSGTQIFDASGLIKENKTIFNNSTTDQILYAQWSPCSSIANAESYDINCNVNKCNAGYYLSSNSCVACSTPGKYCPGGNQTSETACPAGYYCPGATAPSGCDPATSSYDGRCKCPVGKTSLIGERYENRANHNNNTLNSCKENSTSTSNIACKGCYIKGGTPAICGTNGEHCTKFCDTVGCFYLPVNVYY
jgi:uncharacterized repeat protein (TIGR02543 family)